jgi:hypothetical protein
MLVWESLFVLNGPSGPLRTTEYARTFVDGWDQANPHVNRFVEFGRIPFSFNPITFGTIFTQYAMLEGSDSIPVSVIAFTK